jgi:hypothetical protein
LVPRVAITTEIIPALGVQMYGRVTSQLTPKRLCFEVRVIAPKVAAIANLYSRLLVIRVSTPLFTVEYFSM